MEEHVGFGFGQLPSPSVFSQVPSLKQTVSGKAGTSAHSSRQPSAAPPHALDNVARPTTFTGYSDEQPYLLPSIERWDDLPCIRLLDARYAKGGMDDRAHNILRRMAQIIWGIGHEVAIRKKVKLPRAERLAKFQHYCDCLLDGAQFWKRSWQGQVDIVWDKAHSLPRLDRDTAYQDLEPKYQLWREAYRKLIPFSEDDTQLFASLLEHYRDNYRVLYGLHRDKPDYGLSRILRTADKVFGILAELPQIVSEAAQAIKEFKECYREARDRCYTDQKRQEYEMAHFNKRSAAQKRTDFKEWMNCCQPEFVEFVNANEMSQHEFDEHLKRYCEEYMEGVAQVIKYSGGIDIVEIDDDDFEWTAEQVRQIEDCEAPVGGWLKVTKLDHEILEWDLDTNIDCDELDAERQKEEDHFHLAQPEPQAADGPQLSRSAGTEFKPMLQQCEHRSPDRSALRSPVAMLKDHIPSFDHSPSEENRCEYHPPADVLPFGVQSFLSSSTTDQECLSAHRLTAQDGPDPCVPLHISKSFAVVEEDFATRSHHRSSTVPEINYSADSAISDSPRPAASFHGRAIGSRRHGVHVPRIFTGSFSQLESDIRRMQLHKVKTPEDQPDLSEAYDHKVRDFAITPQFSPSPEPSPATLLFRREALLSRETELHDRMINGEVVRSRRPSTKIRAQTVDDYATGGLDAWLGKEDPRGDSPRLVAPTPLRPERKHTI